MNRLVLHCLAAVALCSCTLAIAGGAQSANFAIPFSTLNSGSGGLSSASYKLSSSFGELALGSKSTSTNYSASGGFLAQVKGMSPACILDVDGNGAIEALTDGLIIIRTLSGLTGTSVTNGAIGANATRTTFAEIQPMINLPALDVDGNGSTDALTDGLIVLRAMFGLTGSSVTTGAVGANATRATWTDIRGYLNVSCGTAFAP